MNFNFIFSIIVVIIGYVAFKKLQNSRGDEQIKKLEEQKSKVEDTLKLLNDKRETLKDDITKQQENISEKDKKKFWEEYLGKKND